jgi:hypothetical protein
MLQICFYLGRWAVRLTLSLVAVGMQGCTLGTAPLLPEPPAGTTVADYQAFARSWTGHLPAKNWPNQFPLMPSDTRLLVVDTINAANDQLLALRKTFRRWCVASRGTALDRDTNMETLGTNVQVCQDQAGVKIAALQVFLDSSSSKQGRREVQIRHWFAPAILTYIEEFRAQDQRMAAAQRERAEAAEAAAARNEALKQMRARERAKAATLAMTPRCQAFEQQSNALRARFAGAIDRPDLARYLSDLLVALDDCANAQPAPATALLAVYRFNLENYRLFADVWDEGLLTCDSGRRCQPSSLPLSRHERATLAGLQQRFPAINEPDPARIEEIVDRTVRFSTDR